MSDASAPWPPQDLDDATIVVRRLAEATQELTDRMAKVMAMNATDMTAIAALGLNGPMGATDLARHLGIRTASATTLIDRLERSGHVERVRDAHDRRRVTVKATPAAQQAERAAWATTIEDIDAVSRSLSPDQRSVVVGFVSRVVEVLQASGRTGDGS
ncbi:MarR family winged helix-turn-helix transcriptional regulator [Lentzea sp. NPDC060358]|uniref:MarR family winged helix-turn-helix transcriptional regulator n=1 Tax=Lentzea sp. NPDC060358 TaxID=3347103 RepID=UPI0036639FCD